MFRLFNLYSFTIIKLSIHVGAPQILSYSDDAEEPAFVSRVVNGWPAQLGDVPYQLAFKARSSRSRRTYSTFCGGTIIGPNKVLSAAHCFEERTSGCCYEEGQVSDDILEKTFAVAGNLANRARYSKTDSLTDGQWRRLKSMYIARLYKFPRNDIAVGFTETPFEFNNNVASIPYASQYREYIGKCLVSGYGMISNYQRSDRLLLAHLDLFSASWCSRIHRRNMRKFVCTSSLVSDVQRGDSGGPLVCLGTNDESDMGKGVVVGVVSGNRRRAGSFFTRVSSFKDFIDTGRGFAIRANEVLMSLLYVGILLF